MRFMKRYSAPMHDSPSHLEGGRTVIDRSRGVKARCSLVINALLRLGKGTASELADELNTNLDAGYTRSDLAYALKRLHRERLVNVRTYGNESFYTPAANVVERWRNLPKE